MEAGSPTGLSFAPLSQLGPPGRQQTLTKGPGPGAAPLSLPGEQATRPPA